MASNFSILVDVELDAKRSDLQRKLNELSKGTKVKIDSSDVNKLADATDKAATKAADMILTYQAANTILRRTTEIISAMTEQVFELDRATTDFKKVSDLQGQSLDRYVDKLADMGASVARTASEMVDAATEFRKSGFSDDDSATLALVATQLQNVADGSLSAGEASNFIISQMKAFNLEAKDATHIIDALNAVSNNFAVSSSDLSLNIGKASAALAVGNTKYEQALGLMTAGTEVVRNASRVARGLVSVQSRLTQTLDEQSSTGKALTAWYAQYGIALQDQEGQLRSTFDILQDVAEIWPTLTTNEKDYFLLQQAGANQTQNLAAILSNFQTAIDATATAYNSAGSAAAENAKYMESLEAKVQSVKATFQDLANNVIENDLLKALLDLANKGLQLLNTEAGQSITQVALLTAGTTGLIGVGRYLIGPILGGMKTAFGGATVAATGLAGVLSNIGTLTPTIALLSTLGVIGWEFYKAWKEANPTLEEATAKLEENNEQLKANQERLEEIQGMSWADKTPEIIKEKEALEKENEALQIQITKLKDLRQEKLVDAVNTGEVVERSGFAVHGVAGHKLQTVYAQSEAEAWKQLEKQTGQTREELEKLGWTLKSVIEQVHTTPEEFNKSLVDGANDYIKILKEQESLTDEQIKGYNELSTKIHERAEAIRALGVDYEDLTDDQKQVLDVEEKLNGVHDATIAKAKALSQAQQTSIQQINLIDDAYKKLIKTFPELDKMLSNNNGQWELNASALVDAIESGDKWAEAAVSQQTEVTQATAKEIKRRIALYQAELDAMSALAGGRIGTGLASEEEISKYWQLFKSKTHLQGILAGLKVSGSSGRTVTETETGTGTTSKTSPTDEALKEFQSHYKNLQHMRNMDEIDAERYYGDLRYLIDQYTQDATANMQKYGLTVEQINQNMYQYEEEIYNKRGKLDDKLAKDREKKAKEQARKTKEALEQQKKVYEAAFGYMADKIQEEIDALEKEKDSVTKYWDDRIASVQKVNDELERQIQLEDLQANVAKARQNQMLVFKDGRFQYISNMDEVSQAQAELDKFQRDEILRKEVENLNKLKDQALDSIDQQIKSWEDYKKQWSSVADNYKKEQDRLLAEQVLGIEQEGANWQSRLDNLQSYVNQYNAILTQLNTGSFGGGLGGVSSFGGGYSSGGGGGGYSFGGSSSPTQSFVEDIFSTPDPDISGWYNPNVDFSQAWHDAKESGASQSVLDQIEDLRNQKVEDKYHGKDPNPNWKHANGTTNAPGGISLVGERGPELRVLNSGDGIVPADVTKNLWQWGKTTPSNLMAHLNAGGVDSNTMSVVIESLNLPEVHNGEDFVNYLQNNLWAKTVQFASKK